MQIIPSNSIFESAGIYTGLDTSNSKGENFMDAMEEAFNAVQDGYNHSVTSAFDDPETPLVESPYTRHTTDGVTYTLSEVCFTKNELQELRLALVKEGAPEESLAQFDKLVDQPDGATLAQVIASLTGKKSTEFSEEDAKAITSLLNQIDPSGDLATDVLDFMRRGNGSAALDLIQNALGEMDITDGIEVDVESILALGRGLGLNNNTLTNLINNFGGNDSLTLNSNQFDAFMNPAKSQFMEEAASAQKLDAALEKTLKPILAKARNRMEKEKAAAALQDRRVEQSKVLIDKSVQENSRQMLDDTVTGETNENPAHSRPDQDPRVIAQTNEYKFAGENTGNNIRTAKENEQPANLATPKNNLADNQKDVSPLDVKEDALKEMTGKFVDGNAFANNDSNFGDNNQQNMADIWQNLLGKIDVKPTVQTPVASSFIYSMLDNTLQEAAFINQAPEIPNIPAHVANQVQQGMLTAMRDGSTRLDLQLHPAELGAISITLVARNGEVTAQIKSEKSETADMVSRQIDAIRINLEQQGVKVDKIEVQLENRQDNMRDGFMDFGQHNARQEEQARRQEMMRMRNLAALRGLGEEDMAADISNAGIIPGQNPRYAGNALNVIA